MTEQDRQLVELITNQVLAALRQQGVGSAGSNVSPTTEPAAVSSTVQGRVSVQPPIGQCTGDYSKFPELRGKLYGDPVNLPSSAGTANIVSPPSAALALTGIITANQLQEALTASPDGNVWLAPDARLTPLANDWARQHKEKIRRGSPASQVAGSPQPGVQVSSPSSWLWWIDGQCAAVHEVTRQMQGQLRPLAAGPHASALPQVVRDVASALKTKQIAGAFLFVPNAARAMCYANRCSSIRGVVGTCGEAVEQGVTELGANLLVMEYPHQGPRAMAAMMQRMMQQTPGAPPSVERDLADLHRC